MKWVIIHDVIWVVLMAPVLAFPWVPLPAFVRGVLMGMVLMFLIIQAVIRYRPELVLQFFGVR